MNFGEWRSSEAEKGRGENVSTAANILCKNCDNRFIVYFSSINSGDRQFKCPHCLVEMDEKMSKDVIHALATVHDLNYHFKKYHSEHQEPLFSVSIEETYVPANKFRI